MTVSELLLLTKMNKKEDKYVIDELLREHGHEVLRLSSYHCGFSAIELIWAKAKSSNDHIGRDGYTDETFLNMWHEALETCSEDLWRNCVLRTEKTIADWYDREQNIINYFANVQPIIIEVTEFNSSSSSSSDIDSDMS